MHLSEIGLYYGIYLQLILIMYSLELNRLRRNLLDRMYRTYLKKEKEKMKNLLYLVNPVNPVRKKGESSVSC